MLWQKKITTIDFGGERKKRKKINLRVKIYKIEEHEGKKFERIHSRA
jgi:hypothetical protein